MNKERATYALYRGDELLDVGTATEIAGRRGVRPSTVRFYATAAYRRRCGEGSRRVVAVRVDG